MANNVSNVGFTPQGADMQSIERQRAMAQALQQQSMQQDPTQMAGGWAIRQSPLQGLAKLAQAGAGAYGMNQADERQKQLATQQQQQLAQTLRGGMEAMQGTTAIPQPEAEMGGGPARPEQKPNQMMAAQLFMQNPATQGLGQKLMEQQFKDPKYHVVGDSLVPEPRPGQQGPVQPSFTAPPKPFNLAPDAGRYGSDGKLIVQAPSSPTKTEPPIKPPPGYRMTADKNLEAIPGGPADQKLTGAFNQDTAALQGSMSSMDRLATAANEALNHPGLDSITGLRGMVPNMPGSAAADAQAKLNTLKSQVGFGVLQDMRNNSKTGGALGSVSDAEGKRLEANLAALENAQSADQMRDSLKKIVAYSDQAKERLRSAYNMKHGAAGGMPQKPGGGPAVGTVQGGYRFKGGDPAQQGSWEKVP